MAGSTQATRRGQGLTRRHAAAWIGGLGLATLGIVPAATAAAGLRPTPAQSRGPFYPLELPLDRDNDLVRVDGQAALARGEHTHVVGRVLHQGGEPVRGALVEIWQCDAHGRYHHHGEGTGAGLDPAFQGYGQTRSAADGSYRFRTIKPVPYPGRAPHIHFAVHSQQHGSLVTQMYVRGAPENVRDFLLRRAGARADPLVVAFAPSPDGGARHLARFDIVLGGT